MSNKIKKANLLLVFIIIVETLIIKIFQYKILPEKYFYDSGRILEIMNGSSITDKAYSYTANFMNVFNFLKLNTLQSWSIYLAVIFTVIMSIYFLKEKIDKKEQIFFILSSIGLLNIYVFNLSKDIIQFIYFYIIYIILSSKKLNDVKKAVTVFCILIYIAVVFRVYYGIIAILFITTYLLYKYCVKNSKKNNSKKIFATMVVVFLLQIVLLKYLLPNEYNAIVNSRHNVNVLRENDVAAVTIINDVFGENNNILIFSGNYILNTLRLLLPLELILKGPKYILFVIYQLYFTWNLYGVSKKLNKNNILYFCIVLGFIMTSIIFEPDFGSFIRHESSLVLIILEIIKNNLKGKEDETDIRNSSSL